MLFLRKVISWLYKHSLILFLVSFFLIKIPPFYLFFPIKSALLTTHSLSRAIILSLFALVFARVLSRKRLNIASANKQLLTFFIIYFFFQSISIIGSTNISAFLQRYKDIVFPGLFLFVILFTQNNRNKIIYTLLAASFFNFFYQMLMFFSPSFFKRLGENFIYFGHLELVNINLERARLFIETYDEIAIPFLFVIMAKQKDKRVKFLIFLLFLLIAIPSLLSNFRSRILMLAFAFLASLILLMGRQLATSLSILFAFTVVGYLTVMLLNIFFGFSFIDRFTLQHEQEDVRTVELRLKNLGTSAEMGLASPFFGVGLGNYYDNLPAQKSITLSLFDWRRKEAQIASTNPHNILAQTFSETGVISFLFYIFLTFLFVSKDFKVLKHGQDDYKKAFIISFWTLYLYSIFNPTTTLTYNSLFWVLRAMI